MSYKTPEISVALPVYNGERHMREAIESVLSQTFDDLELVIVDNASSDSTWEICQEYSRLDERVHTYRNTTNIGSYRNFARALQLTRGNYFLWLAHDDILEETYLAKCHSFLSSHPDYWCCYANTIVISPESSELSCLWPLAAITDSDTVERFKACLDAGWRIVHATYGMFRREQIRHIPFLDKPFLWAEERLLLNVALRGKIHLIEEPLRRCRIRPGSGSDGTKPLPAFWSDLVGPDERIPLFPWTRIISILSRDILSLDLGIIKKAYLLVLLSARKDTLRRVNRDVVHGLSVWTMDKPRMRHMLTHVWHRMRA
ncbi:MAG: glycosyltransferase family 2 protein [Thermodesulfobacteriota bacterium]